MALSKIIKNPIFGNIVWLVFEKLITICIVFYAEGLVAKILTTEQYGEWVYSLNFVTLVSSVALVSGAEVAVPALSRNKLLTNEIMTSIFKIRIIFALIAFALVNIYSFMFIDIHLLKIFVTTLSLIILLNEPFSIVINYYQSITRVKSIVILRLISILFRLLVVFICYHFSMKAGFLPWSRVVESVFLAISLIVLWKLKCFSWKENKKIFKSIWLRSFKFWPSLMLMYLYLRMDRLFVEHYLSFGVLAIYGIAVQLTEQTFSLVKMIIQSVSPRYLYSKMGMDELHANVRKIVIILLSVCCFVSLAYYIFMPTVVNLLFGHKYQAASALALTMLPALIFFSIDSVLMQYLYREKKTKLILLKWIGSVGLMTLIYVLYFDILGQSKLSFIYNMNYFVMMSFGLLAFFMGRRKRGK